MRQIEKHSSVASKIPSVNALADGEIALNTNDSKIFIKRDDSRLIEHNEWTPKLYEIADINARDALVPKNGQYAFYADADGNMILDMWTENTWVLIQEEPPPPLLKINWDTQSANTKVTISGASMEYTNDGGATWTNVTGTAQVLSSGVGPYELKEIIYGSVTKSEFRGSTGFNGNITASGGKLITTIQMFSGLSNLLTIDLSELDTSNVTDMSNMFSSTKLASIDISNLDISNVTNFKEMFNACSCTTINMSGVDTSSSVSFNKMFNYNLSLVDPDISSFTTSSVTNTSYMFYDCNEIVNLDTSNFTTDNVVNMQAMFIRCYKLTNIDVSGWNTAKCADFKWAFSNCRAITNINFPVIIPAVNAIHTQMFSGCLALTCLTSLNTMMSSDKTLLFSGCGALTTPNATEQADITDVDGANWVNPGTCP